MKRKYYLFVLALFFLVMKISAAPGITSLINPYNGSTGVDSKPQFSWFSASAPSGYIISKYCIQVSKGSTSSDFSTSSSNFVGENWTANGSTTSKTFDKTLASATKYYWRVVAYSTEPSNNYSVSSIWGFTTAGTPASIPTGLNVTNITATSATISWNASSGTAPITYQYQYGINNVLIKTIKTTSTSATLTGLSPSTTYQFCVLASNSFTPSPATYSSIKVFTTSAGTVTYTDQIPISNIKQLGNNWCWNACSEMVLRWYGVNSCSNSLPGETYQKGIANYACLGLDAWDWLSHKSSGASAGVYTCDEILANFKPGLKTTFDAGSLSKQDIVASIAKDRPIYAAWSRLVGGTLGHIVLIVGYQDVAGSSCEMVVYNDPSNPDNHTPLPTRKFTEFVQNSTYKWAESLRMNVSPSDLPTGANDYVQVSKPARMLTLKDTTLYTAKFTDIDYSGTVAKSWDWKLVLFHDDGEYTITPSAEELTTDSLKCSWRTRIGTLPEGYTWKRDTNGQIVGQVVIYCKDSDPPFYPHFAATDVAYNDGTNTLPTGDKK